MNEDNALITLEELQTIVKANQDAMEAVKEFIGPTSIREIYTRLGVNWSSLNNALKKSGKPTKTRRGKRGGRPRHARLSGDAALEVLTRDMRQHVNRTPHQLAEALRAAASLIERG